MITLLPTKRRPRTGDQLLLVSGKYLLKNDLYSKDEDVIKLEGMLPDRLCLEITISSHTISVTSLGDSPVVIMTATPDGTEAIFEVMPVGRIYPLTIGDERFLGIPCLDKVYGQAKLAILRLSVITDSLVLLDLTV